MLLRFYKLEEFIQFLSIGKKSFVLEVSYKKSRVTLEYAYISRLSWSLSFATVGCTWKSIVVQTYRTYLKVWCLSLLFVWSSRNTVAMISTNNLNDTNSKCRDQFSQFCYYCKSKLFPMQKAVNILNINFCCSKSPSVALWTIIITCFSQ